MFPSIDFIWDVFLANLIISLVLSISYVVCKIFRFLLILYSLRDIHDDNH